MFNFQTIFLKSLLNALALIVLTGYSDPTLSWANPDKAAEQNRKALLQWEGIPSLDASPHTFVFFVNGSANHKVPHSEEDHSSAPWIPADRVDVENIARLAKTCESCNSVILYIHKNDRNWWSSKNSVTASLKVYNKGRQVLIRKSGILNAANPEVLRDLLVFSSHLFPYTDLHLLYRGHGFFPTYHPTTTPEIAPFDFNFPKSAYGIEQFASSLNMANLGGRLKTVTLAACRMSYLEVAKALAPYAQFLIAPQTEFLETLVGGFRYDFLSSIAWHASTPLIANEIAITLPRAFQITPDRSDNRMEHPVSQIQLAEIPALVNRFNTLVSEAKSVKPTFFTDHSDLIRLRAGVKKTIADRYHVALLGSGHSKDDILKLAAIKLAANPSPHKTELDLLVFLDFIKDQNLSAKITQDATDLKTELSRSIQIFNSSSHSKLTGMSFDGSRLEL